MKTLALFLAAFVALEHFGFMLLESYFWTKPLGQKVFQRSEQFLKETAPLGFNQGLYNGFLAAGLVWGLSLHLADPPHAWSILVFFCSCVVVAGIVGAITVKRSILFMQAFPAAAALGALFLSR